MFVIFDHLDAPKIRGKNEKSKEFWKKQTINWMVSLFNPTYIDVMAAAYWVESNI